MFRALFAHPQEALHKRHLVYCVLYQLVAPGLEWNPGAANWQHARNMPSAVCIEPPEDGQVVIETYKGP
jgi:hypothetical protein